MQGACPDPTPPGGCWPTPFVPCNASDAAQQWAYSAPESTFVNAQNSLCLDIYADQTNVRATCFPRTT